MLRAAHTARSTASRLWQLRSAPRSRRSRSDRSSTNASQQVVCQQYVESCGPCSSDPATAGLGGNRSVSLPTTSCRNFGQEVHGRLGRGAVRPLSCAGGVSEPPQKSQSASEGRLAMTNDGDRSGKGGRASRQARADAAIRTAIRQSLCIRPRASLRRLRIHVEPVDGQPERLLARVLLNSKCRMPAVASPPDQNALTRAIRGRPRRYISLPPFGLQSSLTEKASSTFPGRPPH